MVEQLGIEQVELWAIRRRARGKEPLQQGRGTADDRQEDEREREVEERVEMHDRPAWIAGDPLDDGSQRAKSQQRDRRGTGG